MAIPFEKALENIRNQYPNQVEDDFTPIGWLALRCSCGQELCFNLEHIYGINDTPNSFIHGECPTCGKVTNVKIEVWE